MRLQIAACLLIVTNAAPLGASDKRPQTDVGTKYPFTLNELKASIDTERLLNVDKEKAKSIFIAFTEYRDKVRSSSVAPCPSILALTEWKESQQINNTKELSHVFPVDKSIVKQELEEVDPDTASSLSDQQLEKASELFKTWRNATCNPSEMSLCKPTGAQPLYTPQPQTQRPVSEACKAQLKRCMDIAHDISSQNELDMAHVHSPGVPNKARTAINDFQQEACANTIYNCFKEQILSEEHPYKNICDEADDLHRKINQLRDDLSGSNRREVARNALASAYRFGTYSSKLPHDEQNTAN